MCDNSRPDVTAQTERTPFWIVSSGIEFPTQLPSVSPVSSPAGYHIYDYVIKQITSLSRSRHLIKWACRCLKEKNRLLCTSNYLLPPPPPKVKEVMFSSLSVCLIVCLCLFVYRISQKVMDGSGLNLVGRLGVWQWRTASILVKIQIRLQSFFKWFFTIER